MKDEDKTFENETVIDFKKAKEDRGHNDLELIIEKLRTSVKNLMMVNDKHRLMISQELQKNFQLTKEIKDLKQERSDYYNVS